MNKQVEEYTKEEFDKWWKNKVFIINTYEEIGKYFEARKIEKEILDKLILWRKNNESDNK